MEFLFFHSRPYLHCGLLWSMTFYSESSDNQSPCPNCPSKVFPVICFLPCGHSLLRKPFCWYVWHICSIRSLELIFWRNPHLLYPLRQASVDVRSWSLRSNAVVLFSRHVTPAHSRFSLGFGFFILKHQNNKSTCFLGLSEG